MGGAADRGQGRLRRGSCVGSSGHKQLPMQVRLARQRLKQHVHKGLGFFLEKDIKLVQADFFQLLFTFVLFHKRHNILCKGGWVGITHVF